MSKLFSLCLILLFAEFSLAQKVDDSIDYQGVVTRFYELLVESESPSIADMTKLFGREFVISEEVAFMDSCKAINAEKDCLSNLQMAFGELNSTPSLMMKKYRQCSNELLPDSPELIFSLLKRASIQSNILTIAMKNKSVFFSVGRDEDMVTPIIHGIYGTDGAHLLNENEFIKLQGGLVDDDGYVNVRNQPSKSGEVSSKLFTDDFIWFTPSTETNWWRVYSIDRFQFLGYVHNSRIKNFSDLTSKQQNLIIEKNREQHPWIVGL